MLFTPHSIKPPPVNWSPLATLGLAASVGSYTGTTIIEDELGATLLVFATITSIVGLVVKSNRGIVILAGATYLLFIGRAAVFSQHGTKPWTPATHGELVNIQLVLTSDPVVTPKTSGEMAQFDHRDSITRFSALAHTQQRQHNQLNIEVICNDPPNILAGDEVSATGWIHLPDKKNRKAVFYITNIKTIVKTKESVDTVRENVRNNLLLGLQNKQKTLANALFFGVRDSGWMELSTIFRRAGMSHILAISGMHIAIVLLFICVVVKKTPFHKGASTLLIIIITCLLVGVVEPRTPVTRALVMIILYLLLQLFLVRCKSISLLAISAIGILIYDPVAAGTIGFQLSFIVVASILVLFPQVVWRTLGPEDVNASSANMLKRWLSSIWITGLCAWVVATPVSAHVFGTISPIGPFSNIPSIFMLTVTLFVGTIKTTVTLVFGQTFPAISSLFSIVLSKFILLASECGTTPFSYIEGIFVSWFWSFAFVSLVFVLVFTVRHKKTAWFLSLLTISIWLIMRGVKTNETTITTINVGHGTCHVIQNKSETVIIDAGSRNNFDVGSNTIVPSLYKLGIKQIKTLFVTHSDIDHICGIIDIAQKFQIKKIIVAKQTMRHKTPPLSAVLKELKTQHIPVLEKNAGWDEKVGGAKITMLSPNKNDSHRSSNAASIVLMLETHGRNLLFTGDIDEKKIAEITPTLTKTIDVIELPHHGQWSEESKILITTKRPKAVIQSTNISRHAKDQWFIPQQTERFVTAIDGTITIKINRTGHMSIVGSKQPATMPRCVFLKQQ